MDRLVENINYADELVREYLIFRGFSQTFKSFNIEKKYDKNKGYQASKVVEALLYHVQQFNLPQLLELWTYLNETHFVKSMETKDQLSVVQKLELSLKRCYVINCIAKGNMEKLKEFFTTCGEELSANPEWTDWFAIPYMKSPQSHPHFRDFFSRSWVEGFQLSLTNFLSTTFNSGPLPKLLNFNAERAHRKLLEDEITRLQQELAKAKAAKRKFKQQMQNAISGTASLSHTTAAALNPNNNNNNNNNDKFGTAKYDTKREKPEHTPVRKTSLSLTGIFSPFLDKDKNDSGVDLPRLENSLTMSTPPPNPPPRSSPPPIRPPSIPIHSIHKPFVETVLDIYTAHTAPITRCKFSPQGSEVASASADGSVRIWSLQNSSKRQPNFHCFSEVLSLTWQPKGNRMLLCGTEDARVKVWNAATDKLVYDLKLDLDVPRVLDIACSPNGQNFVTTSTSTSHNKASLIAWNMRTFQMISKLPVDPDMIAINCSAFNHNGSLIATGGSDGMIRIYDMSYGSPIMGWNAHEGQVISIQFSYDETSVFSMGSDGKICQWSIHHIGSTVRSFEYEGFIRGTHRSAELAFDGLGEFFLVGSKGNHGLLYKVDNPVPMQHIGEGHSLPVVTVDWTHTEQDQALCVTGSLDHSVRVCKLDKVS